MNRHDDWRGRSPVPGILPALIVIGVGLVFLLDNLNIVFLHDVWRYWPVALIAVGLAKLVDSPAQSGRIMGGILMCVGGLLLAGNLGFMLLSWNTLWPLIPIGVGLLMLWHRLTPAPAGTPEVPVEAHEGVLNEYAVFGGVHRKVTTDDFRGGQTTATFGGVEIDLRRARMRGDSAVIDVTAMFGGVEFKVPPTWLVIGQVMAVFGGFGNKALEPDPEQPGIKRLYIKGTAMFGGVEVKN